MRSRLAIFLLIYAILVVGLTVWSGTADNPRAGRETCERKEMEVKTVDFWNWTMFRLTAPALVFGVAIGFLFFYLQLMHGVGGIRYLVPLGMVGAGSALDWWLAQRGLALLFRDGTCFHKLLQDREYASLLTLTSNLGHKLMDNPIKMFVGWQWPGLIDSVAAAGIGFAFGWAIYLAARKLLSL